MSDFVLPIISAAPPTLPLFMRLATSSHVIPTITVDFRNDPTTITGSIGGLAPRVTIGAEAFRNLFTLLQSGATSVQLSCTGTSVFGFSAFPTAAPSLMESNINTIAGAMREVVTLLGSIDCTLKQASGVTPKEPELAAVEDLPVNDTGTG